MRQRIALSAFALACFLALPSIAEARYRDGMNLYEYVRSGPVNYVDPPGEGTVVASGVEIGLDGVARYDPARDNRLSHLKSGAHNVWKRDDMLTAHNAGLKSYRTYRPKPPIVIPAPKPKRPPVMYAAPHIVDGPGEGHWHWIHGEGATAHLGPELKAAAMSQPGLRRFLRRVVDVHVKSLVPVRCGQPKRTTSINRSGMFETAFIVPSADGTGGERNPNYSWQLNFTIGGNVPITARLKCVAWSDTARAIDEALIKRTGYSGKVKEGACGCAAWVKCKGTYRLKKRVNFIDRPEAWYTPSRVFNFALGLPGAMLYKLEHFFDSKSTELPKAFMAVAEWDASISTTTLVLERK